MVLDNNVILYGTAEDVPTARTISLGPLTFLYTDESIRRICWNGTELIRAIAWPIRDENWGTYAPKILESRIDTDDRTIAAQVTFTVAEGALECVLQIDASSDGKLDLRLTMTPRSGSFATNRAGFTVLHPIDGIAGAPLAVTHSDGAIEQTAFPKLISPSQPVFDIQGLSYTRDGDVVDINFEGEKFEMEDQRNWSDASYKTYCVPLVYPFRYEINRPTTQSIRVTFTGDEREEIRTHVNAVAVIQETAEVAPQIGLAVEPGWLGPNPSLIPDSIGVIRARMKSDDAANDNSVYLHELKQIVQGREFELELVLSDDETPEDALDAIRSRVVDTGLAPNRVTALRESYLASHQPSGPWPEGPGPDDVLKACRTVFPDLDIGGGMLTNFTEFNRCRPNLALCDFVTHANTAIVHACDDLSVCETLEALPQVFESARAIAEDKPYRLGLTAIGMRSNPYGAAVSDNPDQIRRTMAREDPRQRGLFAAAWAVGVLAGTLDKKLASLCLAAPTGPFGIIHAPQTYPQAYFDNTPEARFYPLYHVVKAAAALSGQRRLTLAGLPPNVFAYGGIQSGGARLLIANASPESVTVQLSDPGMAVMLDQTSFTASTTQEDWLEKVPRQETALLDLGGFAVAFIDLNKKSTA
jgi:hypothetical protein